MDTSIIRSFRGAPNKRAYAIGDVHGRLDLLVALLERIEADHSSRPPKEAFVILLGDLIDRGPDSRKVIDLLRRNPPRFCKTLCIMGNHEEALVRGLRGEPHILSQWLQNGGYECAQSYGAPVGQFIGAAAEAVDGILRRYIPSADLEFMASMHNTIQFGEVLFAHAGVRPGASLSTMGSEVRWIRDDFLNFSKDFGWLVVHGHTISEEIEIKSNRIGVDTGAYKTGVLSAIRVEDDELSFLQVRDSGWDGAD